MTLVVRSTYIETIRYIRMPVGLRASNSDAPSIVTEGHRYQSIGSLQALGLAVAAAVVTPMLLWLVL
ncbi:MAG: hypothetical protein K2Y56_03225 [Methylobacterium sp.]|uniref:hypothetical protein n=1 Tax=Methylobacterium sp. TaxID=409 RepID=UPI0025F029C8|nr:hypothetical protein [Methylobacterium sp.]MBX9930542.1 hypothetical protein [Methylobacterium sp.]